MSTGHHDNHREKNIKTAVFLNVAFTIIEVIGGLWTNSLAILSDALHDFGDSIALIISWIAENKAKKPADSKRTFGYQRLSLFSALFTGIVLVAGSIFILSEAIPRLLNPEHTNALGMMGIAVLGVIMNTLGMWRLKKGQSQNEKVLSWHLLEDVLGWAVILIGGIIMYFWDNYIVDPIMTIGFTLFVLWGVFKNLKGTFNIFMEGVPEHINLDEVKQVLLQIKGVNQVHDLHIWSLEGETHLFTGHVMVVESLLKHPEIIQGQVKKILRNYNIKHSTIELESERFCSGVECESDLGRNIKDKTD